MPSSRAASPAPPSIGGSSHHRQDSFDSYFSDKEKSTNRSSRFDNYRRALGGRRSPVHKHPNSSPSSSSKPHSPTVNVYTHCGRHTDQYLLGGWSDVVKSAFRIN